MADPKLTSFSSMFNALGNQQAPVADQAAGSFSSALGGLGSTPAPAPAPTVTDQKRANVEETKVAKALALADDETLRTIAAAQINGNDLAENPILQELRTETFGNLLQKYGPEVARNRHRILRQEMSLESALNASRSDSDLAKDTGIAVAQGAFNMAGGIQSLGLGMINDDLGAWSAGLIDRGSEWFDDQKSGTFRERMEVKGLMGALDDMDNEAQYQKDLADESTVSASDTLRYWGRSAADEVGRVISDPAELGDFVAQNVGSLLPSTAAAKAAQAAAKGTRLAKAAVPTAVALGESGSAYVGAVNRVMEMTEEDLMQNSPDYRELRASGFTDAEARTEIATDAGMLAAAVQFPVAAVAGKFVERFEANPLSQGGVGQALKDIGSQTVEEAVQEATGQFNQNLGIQTFADETQRLDEGVAEGGAMGALGGAGMAAVVKAPGALGSVAAAGAKAAGRGLQQAADARRSQLEEQEDSQNPVGTTNTKTNLQNIDQTLNKVVTNTVANPSSTGEVDQAQMETVNKIRSVAEVGTSELAQMPAAVKSMILSPEEESSLAPDQIIPRGAVMFALLDKMRSAAPEVRKEAVLWLNDQVNRLGSLQGIDLAQLDEVTREDISAVIQASNQVMSNSTVSKAVEEAATMTQADLGHLPDVTPETINTPEVQKAIGNTVALAQANPAGVDPKFIDTILEQTTNGTVNIDRAVADRLRLASHIAKTMQSAEANKETLVSSAAPDEQGPARKSVAQVREEILRKGKNNDLNQYGLDRHMAEIMTAQAQGDTERLSALMQNLRNFAESMQNKVAAANESIKIGDPSKNKVPYRAWTGSQWIETGSKNAKKFYVFPGSTNNVLTGRAVVEDATMVANLYDGLLERLGGAVEGTPVNRVQADPLIAQAAPVAAPEAVSQPARASDLPAEAAEPEEAAPAKERRIRKDAVLQSKDSLIDETESDPVRPIAADVPAKESDDAGTRSDEPAREPETDRSADPEAQAEEGESRVEEEARGEVGTDEGADAQDQSPDQEEESTDGEQDGSEGGDENPVVDAPNSVVTFPNLTKTAGGFSRVARAYVFSTVKSPFLALAAPARAVMERLRDHVNGTGKLDLGYAVPADEAKIWSGILGEGGKAIMDDMNARLTQAQSGIASGKMTVLEALQDESIDLTGWAEGKVLNLVDETTGAYDPRLQQLAVMAGFHWVFTQIRNPNPKIEDVAKMFGIQESDVTDEIMDMARRGMSTRLAKESLARTIMEFWGAEMNKDAPMSDTLGIAQAMAIEVLVAMNGRFVFFERQKDTLAKGKIAKEYFPIELEHESTKETVDRLTHTKGLLGEMLTPQAEKSYYIGDDMPPPPKTIQKRNFLGKLGTKILNVLGKHQQIEFRRNKPFLDALQALDRDTFFELMGYEPVEDGITNRKHRKSIEGKNKQIELSWAGVMAHNARLEAKAGETGANPDELISRFPWYVVSNERIHAAGFNPQSDKLMREALVSTNATLDMTDDAQRSLFWLTVGQSSGAIKTEGIYETESEAKWVAEFGDIHATTAGKVEALVRDTFGDAIDALKSWMERGDESMSAEERALFVTSIKEAKKGFTPKLFHSLLAVARYDMAGENEVKAFQHSLSLEADGKTDGPMAAIVNWSTGAFTSEELKNQRRGGFFLAQLGQTLNAQVKRDSKDLYETTADITKDMLVRLKRHLERDALTEPMAEQQHRLMRLLSAFSSDLKYDAEARQVVEVKRGLLKNPLTITIYGSGEKGIAGKVSREIIDGVYEAMTRVEKMRRDLADPSISLKDLPEFAGYPEIENDLRALAMSAVIRFKDKTTGEMKWGMTKTVDGRPSSFPRNMGKDFELSPEAVEMINTNMLHLMVKPMRVAINSVVGNSMDNLKVFQNATQFMSKVMIERFREEVKKALAKRENKSEFLSQNEYEAIFQEMSKFGAIIAPIDSNNHHLNLSASETAQSAYTFSGGLDREFTGGASLAQPSDAGVAAAPLMTISRGDATMMVNYFASKDPDLRVLPVFDGLEMPADGIAEISERINKAVADAWLGENGAIDMRDSFRDFMQQGLNEDEKKEAAKLRHQLEEIALETEARKAVMRRVSYSMDHMASGRTPFNNEGEAFDYDPAALDYDEKLAEWLNVKLEEERANLAGAAQERAAQTGVEQENPAFMDLVKASGAAVGDMGVTRLTTTNMARVLQQLGERGGVTKEKMRVFQLLRPLLPEFTFLVGSKADLEAYRSHRFGVQGQALGMGQIDFRNGMVYVASGSPETVLHEMLHAVTMKLSLAYYDDPSSLSEGQKVAFKNLERLMEQFQGLDFTETTEASLEVAGEKISVATMLQRQLASLGQGKDALSKAKALNEFMAWTLTNQDLIETLKKTRVRAVQDGFLKGLLTEMVQIMRDSMKAVRKLLGFGSEVPMDMFSNIAFNTGMLVYGQPNAQPGVLVEPVGTVLQQTIGAPVDLRIQRIMEAFQTKVGVHLDNLAAGPGARPAEELNIYRVADEALNRVSANFFKLDDQQKQAFRVIQAYFASSTKFDSAALTRMEKVFAHVTGQLSVDSFVNDPTNPNDVIRAERMYNTLMGGMGYEMDRQGRSNLMATFVALSQVHPGFRSILKSIDLPKGMKTDFSSLDDMLTTSAEKALDSLERAMSGDSTKNRTTLQSMDDLAAVLAVVRQDEQTRVEQMAASLMDKADTTGSKLLTKGADRLSDFADKLLLNQQAGIRGRAKETVAQSSKVVAALMDGERGLALAQAVTSQLNTSDRMPLFIKELINDVIGMTNENEAIYSMVNRVKYAVSKLRQEYRTETPKVIAKQFTRPLLDKEWSAMHLMLGRTDLAALGSDKSMSEIMDLLQDKKKREIEAKRLMEVIRVKMPRMFPFYDEQAQNLARYMVTGEIDSETRVFHRNAEAIARLLGTGMNGTSDQEVIDALDQLVTLYALEMVPQDVADTTMNLIKTEKDGVEFVAYYLASIRQKEQSRVQGEVARFNSYKGYVPMETPDGASLKVADDADMKVLISQGYTRIGDYRGTGIEKGSKGYYYSAVSGRNTYSQGVMQTVHTSAFGVDPRTGFTVNGTTAGVIQGRAVPYIEKQMATRSQLGKETLMPVFDEKGNTVAYERSLDPQMAARLRRNDHIGEMLGAWAGRQSEEEMGQQFNRDLVKRTYDIYRKATGRRGEFVNLADPNLKDPILIDAWKMVPKDTKDYIEELYGEGEFWVRKDMVNATVGYRMPSVSDFWNGLSRMSPEFQKSFVDTATLVFGKNTFRYLVTAEKAWQTGVSMAKHIIVVSSVIVPVSNFLSNFVQLTLNGVPLRSIGKGMASKLVEIDQHLKHLDRMVEIQTLMARYQTDRTMTQKLEAELQSLKDADRRMSIWPLIEAGEFSTISEGLTELDGSLTEGKWADVMSRLSEKIPAQFGTVGRYAAITRDTALFKGMSRATQYGDFLARAVLYDHLLSQGKTSEEALRQITEEFVNYNFLPGRTMGYAESMGMIWFSAYKLRSMKVALNHLRNNPVRALLLNVNPLGVNLPGMDVGSPISDNLASVIADGRLGYSIGPGMLFRAPEMNPWVNLIN